MTARVALAASYLLVHRQRARQIARGASGSPVVGSVILR